MSSKFLHASVADLATELTMRFGRLACYAAAVVLVVSIRGKAAGGNELPPWLRDVCSTTLPVFDKSVPAAALLNEQRVTVDEDGKVTTVERYAARILTREGRNEAVATVSYITQTGKVREMRAWLVRPSGDVKRYGKDEIVDLAAAPNDVFDEVRIKMISARDDADANMVFGYEIISEDRSVFTQFEFQFQLRLPTMASRFSLSVPSGWRAEGVTFNHRKVEPTVNGTSYTWELSNLPFIKDEPASPPVTTLAARLAVSYYPPAGKKAGAGRTFSNWSEVSQWLTELADPQMVLDDDLAKKAKQLVSAAKTERERIAAIGRYVQGVNYVSIQTGVGRGGGYKPRAATEVFAKSYGDCKDKANLMRAMLKAIGIVSHPVVIYSGDRTYVREEWASPQQFNHCIIAVKVGDDLSAATVITHPGLGRLLIFDPTDDNTPVGDLPDHEQGSLALVVAGDAGALIRMPLTPPEANRLERQTELEVAPDGAVTAILRERSIGQSAVDERRLHRSLPRSEYIKAIEQWVTNGASGAVVSKVDPVDSHDAGQFALDVEFKAARYGQLIQDRLLIFKPVIVSRRESLFLTEALRNHPIVIDSHAYNETVTAKLPTGFQVDELPEDVKLEAPFGEYSAAYQVKEGKLVFTRKLVLRSGTIPVERYRLVREFFEKIRAAEQAQVILMKK